MPSGAVTVTLGIKSSWSEKARKSTETRAPRAARILASKGRAASQKGCWMRWPSPIARKVTPLARLGSTGLSTTGQRSRKRLRRQSSMASTALVLSPGSTTMAAR